MAANENLTEQLYAEHGAAILNYLRKRSSGAGVAEDLLQETFLRVVRQLERSDRTITHPKAWLFGVARKVLAGFFRKRSTLVELPLDYDLPAPEQAENRNLERMRDAIAQLPPKSREPLELRLVDELTYEEIAMALSIPIGTVRSRLHNAVKQLKHRLEKGGRTDETEHA
jgi:RNA polymerase sigma-70 factor, ECF subfamily